MDALILAAGRGSRIEQYHTLPKGFLSIGGMTLIEQSIRILQYYGIKKIGIVTGYRSETYLNLAAAYKDLYFIHNDDYATSGSLYSWFAARDWIRNDFILLESDIVYAEKIIPDLLNSEHHDAILVSEHTGVHDAVLIDAQNDFLIDMSKDPGKLQSSIGELVGISKVTLHSYQLLVRYLKSNSLLCKTGHYETDGLVWLAKNKPIFCQRVAAPSYCEIDDNEHLQTAISIYPQLRKNSVIF